MRTITLEEHVTLPEMTGKIPAENLARHTIGQSPGIQRVAKQLEDITGERLASMNKNSIDVQVLSVAGAGADLLSAADGPAFAREYNDVLANKIAGHTDRFKVFAHLPTTNPDAAALEFQRTVNEHGFCGALISGLTDDEFLDNPKYAPLFECAQAMDLPIYLHPGLPPKAVADAYYNNLPKDAGTMLSIAGWGWHSETAIHVLRLIVSGTFDRYPKLKLIIGHMGEMLPMMMARSSNVFKPETVGNNKRTVAETLKDQVYITTSGLFTQPPLKIALDTFGIDNIMFSVDYPFSPNEAGRQFLNELSLSDDDLEKLTHKNAERLLKI